MKARIASLDLLRGGAAFAVAVPHFFLQRQPAVQTLEAVSVVAVEVFFVLSGFVLAPQILTIVQSRSLDNLRVFLIRRWMRTVPPYLVALILISTLVGAIGSADFWRYATYLQNLIGQANQRDYFAIAWSLSVEEWFYVVFPVFLLAGDAGSSRLRGHPLALTVIFIVLVSAIRIGIGDGADWGAAVRRVVLFRIDSIAYGFILFLLLRGRGPCIAALATPAVVATAALTFVLLDRAEGSRLAQAAYPPAAALFGCSLILLALSLEERAKAFAATADFAGRISYPVYLFHLLPIYLLGLVGLSLWQSAALFLAATVALASMSAYWLEQPILDQRPDFPAARARNDIPGAPADSLAVALQAATPELETRHVP